MPRLGFSKSRKGCTRCKQRRIKCDEEIPCGPCMRRNEECPFLSLTPSSDASAASPNPASALNTDEWMLDLECLHHYNTGLYYLGAREEVVHLWRDYIPQQALKHPFLMHGLLAYAALHLAHTKLDEASKYLRLHDKHQALALAKYRSILSSPVDPELADALFALAALLSLSSMARSKHATTMDMDSVAELFIMTKGIAHITGLYRDHIIKKQSPMRLMLMVQTYPENTIVHLPRTVCAQFEALHQMFSTYGLHQGALEHCQSALSELEEIYRNIAYFAPTDHIEIAIASRWQVDVSMGYVRLIQARNPPALVVLAYYAAAITAIRTAWYTQNWAECALRGISEALDEGMQHWIQWPMQQLQDRMSELGVRSPVEKSRGHNL